jgi:hypothetical protein
VGSREGTVQWERHRTRPLTAEDGASLVWKARKQTDTGCHFNPFSFYNLDLLSSEFTVPQFIPLEGMKNSTLHSQEMNSEHLPLALMDTKYLSVGLCNQGTRMVVKRCNA